MSADVRRHALVGEQHPQQPRDPGPGRAGPDQHDPGLGCRQVQRPERRDDAGHDDRRRALDVVVERRDPVAVAVEDAQRVVLLEVLPLDDAAGPDLGDAGDERLDQRVVLGTAQPRRPVAEVQRVGQERRVVRPHIERDRQGQRRMDAAGRGVQGELADRDGHAAGALVAEAQDPLVVGDDDEPDVLVRALAQELRDAVAVGRRDPGAAGPPDDVAELLARAPDRRRVDDRQELVEVFGEEPVEQRRVAVLEGRQPDVLLERIVLDPEVLELEVDLLLDRQDAVRQEPAQPERIALDGGEREVLRQEPAAEEGRACEPDRGRATGGDGIERGGEGTHAPSIAARLGLSRR